MVKYHVTGTLPTLQKKKTVHIPRGIMQIADSTMANLNASQEIKIIIFFFLNYAN